MQRGFLTIVGMAAVALGCDGGGSDLTAPPGQAARIAIVTGDAQTAAAATQLSDSLIVRVTDSRNRPVPGLQIAFAPSAGTVTPTKTTTNADGRTGATWVLGPVPGPQTVTATVTESGAPSGLAATFHATATLAAPVATVATDLGPVVGASGCSDDSLTTNYYSTAYDVNNGGVVVGETSCASGETATFRWSQATGMQQLVSLPGGNGTSGGRINNGGYIAALYSTNNNFLDFRPIIWTPTDTRMDLAKPACYPGPDCNGVPPADINDANEVVGAGGGPIASPWRWTPAGGLVLLTALGDATPVAVNGQGDIAGATPASYPALGGTVILSGSGSLMPVAGLQAQDMNDQREVVGATGTWPTTTAAFWSNSAGIRQLGTLGGTTSFAYGINNHGEVVGSSTTGNGAVHAFYWTASRGMVDLGPGIANAISDAGDIVGLAPTGLFPPSFTPEELWQATMWRGTGGVAASAVAARVSAAPTGHTAGCFGDAANWQSKGRMFRCLASHVSTR